MNENGICFLARDTCRLARNFGLIPSTTPLENMQSNDMAEAFVRILKRAYVRVSALPDAESALRQVPVWLARYNNLLPYRALGHCSPREFIAQSTQ